MNVLDESNNDQKEISKQAEIEFEQTQSMEEESDIGLSTLKTKSVQEIMMNLERPGDITMRACSTKTIEKEDNDGDGDGVDGVFDNRNTDWFSMNITIFMQFVAGLQISVHYMSMWPYMREMDTTADINFLGWVIASCSIGCTIANPIFGYWNQRTMSVKWPAITGFLITSIGQLMYAMVHIFNHRKWWLLVARFITGIGVGNVAVFRVYAATASVPNDRMKAISLGTAGFGLGFSVGPVISSIFTPIGHHGLSLLGIPFTMFTAAALVMVLTCLLCCLLCLFFFKESFVGIVNCDDHDHVQVIVPKFDKMASIICIYLFMIATVIATNIEVMSTPLTTVLYDWEDSKSIFVNGIAIFVSSMLAVILNILIGCTRVGSIDKRTQMLFSIAVFLLYQVFMYPWWFYSGPLNYQKPTDDISIAGGCPRDYEWCSHTTRVPLPLFYFSFVVLFGVAFPFVESPAAALFSEVIGPRKQGNMQGLFSFGGSIAPVIASLSSTNMFVSTGYKYVILSQTGVLILGAILIMCFYNRLVPLKLEAAREPRPSDA